MPACPWASPAQSTPRPENSAQLLTQWRYGSWTAVRKQIGYWSVRAQCSLWIYLIALKVYTKTVRFFAQILALFSLCRLWENVLLGSQESDLPSSLTENENENTDEKVCIHMGVSCCI